MAVCLTLEPSDIIFRLTDFCIAILGFLPIAFISSFIQRLTLSLLSSQTPSLGTVSKQISNYYHTMSNLPPSPVTHAFSGIQWDPMQKLRLNQPEKLLLRSAEANPIDYTLSDPDEARAYVKVVLKVLAEASGASGPSSKVSHLKELLPEEEALPMLYTDPMGVVTHYAITKLYDVIVCLKEKKKGSEVSIGSTFYNGEGDGNLIDEWRPLLRVLHLGGSGDAFAQRKFL